MDEYMKIFQPEEYEKRKLAKMTPGDRGQYLAKKSLRLAKKLLS